ncbi:hypothetical protein INN71_08215 [Nocardioides sp. ChNu-153]|uniref:cell division protein PerM n=1 Tax=unclassified Nocardioides TaxID=2615069 RepID=UPI002405DE82|nr:MULTISPECIES: DUF6350 family protein [unclassified Nocardioides]MDF9717326.1 hypothetical protein [Nocardioides sp. ChNu-99]MDN7121375.1 hypothetical protein [Nocardioides sp. ChNu-153]
MTSVLPGLRSRPPAAPAPRSLVLVASAGGAVAALSTLVVALAVGVVGWFVTDAGAHGRPSGALRVGALGWLTGHGSGVDVQGTPVTMVPLGITLVCAVVCWRLGLRTGETLAPHGPDARAIAAGERDLVVPTAVGLFAAAYVVAALLVAVLASGPGDGVSLAGVLTWSLLLAGGVGGAGVAVGSGRAAVWADLVPVDVRDGLAAAVALVLAWTVVAGLLAATGLALGLSDAASTLSRLETGPGTAVLVVGLALLLVPNMVVMAGAYGLGPGFALGTGTVVAPSAVALGPVPVFPLVAATPAAPVPGWLATALLLAPFVLAAVVVALVQRVRPTTRLEVGAVRGGAAGVLAGLALGVVARLAGGAVGPGRMAEVGPFAGDVTVHAVVAFATGGLVGGLLMTLLQRRRLPAA